jgi:hypothetical protein
LYIKEYLHIEVLEEEKLREGGGNISAVIELHDFTF